MDWFYTNGRSKHGPIDEDGVRIRAEKGYITADTLLWHEGLDGWKKASELGFASAVAAPVHPDRARGPQSMSDAFPETPLPAPASGQPSINVSVNTGLGLEQPISVGNWLLTFIVMCIPLVNVVMLFVWAFGGSFHRSKSNWARAALLMMLIILLGWLLFFVILGSLFASAFH